MDRVELISRLESMLRGAFHAVNAKTKERLSDFGLSLPRLWVLVRVWYKADISMSDLTAELHMAKSSATRLVDELVRDQLLTRERDPLDRRVLRLNLTERGQELIEQVLAYRRELVDQAVSSLSLSQLTTLVQQFEEITAKLDPAAR